MVCAQAEWWDNLRDEEKVGMKDCCHWECVWVGLKEIYAVALKVVGLDVIEVGQKACE